jgi:hypothetical protein
MDKTFYAKSTLHDRKEGGKRGREEKSSIVFFSGVITFLEVWFYYWLKKLLPTYITFLFSILLYFRITTSILCFVMQ